ncbi:hypothetical protein AB0B25_31305 [Nocardia sp. NPDC049190]|uniref:hypothetical protein n=1 Tax=Nocardia sp. NPDC049190 TaxID=3155650 RepID=UPI00340AFB48
MATASNLRHSGAELVQVRGPLRHGGQVPQVVGHGGRVCIRAPIGESVGDRGAVALGVVLLLTGELALIPVGRAVAAADLV